MVGVALAHGVNANQLRRWMRERGIEPPELSCLLLRSMAREAIGSFVPVQRPHRLELRHRWKPDSVFSSDKRGSPGADFPLT